jgi:hypothetical protein
MQPSNKIAMTVDVILWYIAYNVQTIIVMPMCPSSGRARRSSHEGPSHVALLVDYSKRCGTSLGHNFRAVPARMYQHKYDDSDSA